MTVRVATSLVDACAALTEHPGAAVLAGGTDLMVAINRGRLRPSSVVTVGRVPDLTGCQADGNRIRLGAGLTYRELMAPDLAEQCPALAQADRTVGSPQIRNAGTLGGNLGTASPAGDLLSVLVALDAVVHLRTVTDTRELPVTEFLLVPSGPPSLRVSSSPG